MLSFGYDVEDLYKTELTVPITFRAVAEAKGALERHVRIACRDRFVSARIPKRIIPDIQSVLMMAKTVEGSGTPYDEDAAAPGFLWDLSEAKVEGGRRVQATETEETEDDHGGPNP